MKNIENLKYAVFSEWASDYPGGMELLYDAWGENYEDLLDALSCICEHFEGLYEEDRSSADEAFDEIFKDKELTHDKIRDFSWSGCGIGCNCVMIAEGKQIVPKAVDMLMNTVELCDVFNVYLDDNGNLDESAYDEEDLEEDEDVLAFKEFQALIKDAEDNPDDVDKTIALLEAISELYSGYDDCACG